MGASNHTLGEREKNDFYATDPKAAELLLTAEKFAPRIWEPACGAGHLARVFEENGYEVTGTDLVYRGYGTEEPLDFLEYDGGFFEGDIVTNPPYTYARQFIEKALDTVKDGHKVAAFLKLQFLEGKARKEFFELCPPRTLYVMSERIKCAKNGDFSVGSSAIAYAWYVWNKGYDGPPEIKWL